jgi:hypothetical protein
MDGGVYDSGHIKLNLKENTKDINLASYGGLERDINLFCLFWNKWASSSMCSWVSNDAVKEYQAIRGSILSLWRSKQYTKDLYYELQVLDIFMMQKHESIGGNDYSGSACFWPVDKWRDGLYKWLSSSTKSHMGGNRKAYINKCIKWSQENDETEDRQESKINAPKIDGSIASYSRFEKSIKDALEAHQIHNDNNILTDAFLYILDTMKIYLSDQEIEHTKTIDSFNVFWSCVEVKS